MKPNHRQPSAPQPRSSHAPLVLTFTFTIPGARCSWLHHQADPSLWHRERLVPHSGVPPPNYPNRQATLGQLAPPKFIAHQFPLLHESGPNYQA